MSKTQGNPGPSCCPVSASEARWLAVRDDARPRGRDFPPLHRPETTALTTTPLKTGPEPLLIPLASPFAHPSGRRQLVHGVQDMCESTRTGLVAKGTETS